MNELKDGEVFVNEANPGTNDAVWQSGPERWWEKPVTAIKCRSFNRVLSVEEIAQISAAMAA
jgi:hypothetical protein